MGKGKTRSSPIHQSLLQNVILYILCFNCSFQHFTALSASEKGTSGRYWPLWVSVDAVRVDLHSCDLPQDGQQHLAGHDLQIHFCLTWPPNPSKSTPNTFNNFFNACWRTRTSWKQQGLNHRPCGFQSLTLTTRLQTSSDPEIQFILEADTSDTGVGAVLSQKARDKKSTSLRILLLMPHFTERHYSIADRKLLAIKLAMEEWRNWLQGSLTIPCIVWTDHRNLEYLRCAKRLNPRQLVSVL